MITSLAEHAAAHPHFVFDGYLYDPASVESLFIQPDPQHDPELWRLPHVLVSVVGDVAQTRQVRVRERVEHPVGEPEFTVRAASRRVSAVQLVSGTQGGRLGLLDGRLTQKVVGYSAGYVLVTFANDYDDVRLDETARVYRAGTRVFQTEDGVRVPDLPYGASRVVRNADAQLRPASRRPRRIQS